MNRKVVVLLELVLLVSLCSCSAGSSDSTPLEDTVRAVDIDLIEDLPSGGDTTDALMPELDLGTQETDTTDATVVDNMLPDGVDDTFLPDSGEVEAKDTLLCTVGEPCDDQNPCTEDDILDDECICSGSPVECDDGLTCTDDSCNAEGSCEHHIQEGYCAIDEVCYNDQDAAPENICLICSVTDAQEGWTELSETICDDGDACTVGDTCTNGVCSAGPDELDCEDNNVCTDDSCLAESGCEYTFNVLSCDDADACTVGDVCIDGACTAGPDPLDCNDQNPCTDDTCDTVDGCVHTDNQESCDDSNPCQTGDYCLNKECHPGPDITICQDGNDCTDDNCDPVVGCQFTNNLDSCDDGDICTENDACNDGSCAPGPDSKDCSDGNDCTEDSCEPFFGCLSIPQAGECNDQNPCTQFDTCSNGVCGGQVLTCDDFNDCTDDSCDPDSGCVYVAKQVADCQPELTVVAPLRGTTLDGDSSVLVLGNAVAQSGSLAAIHVNGEEVVFDDLGEFSHEMELGQGLNTLSIKATDDLGGVKESTRAIYYSTDWYDIDMNDLDSGLVHDGALIVLGPELFDDDDTSDLDDVATLMYHHLSEVLDIADLIPNPVVEGTQMGCEYTVSMENIKHDDLDVDITLIDGGFTVTVIVPNLTADVIAEISDGMFCPESMTTEMTITSLTMSASTQADLAENGFVIAELTDVSATIEGMDMGLGAFESLVAPEVESLLETEIPLLLEEEFSYTLPKMLENIVGAFNYDFTQSVEPFMGDGPGTEVRLLSRVTDMDLAPEGFTIWSDTAVLNHHVIAHDPLGSIGRALCLGSEPVIELPYDPFGSMSWYKDYFNEFPFAMYYGNLFGMEVDQDEFETNLEDYNLTGSTFSIDFVLPPVLSDCVDGVELELQVGDMRIDIAGLFFDQQIDATVWASYRVPAKIATYKLESGETALKLELTGEPSFMSAEVSGLSSDLPVEAEPLLLDVMRDVVIAEFIDLFAAGALGGIYIPGLQIVEAFEGLPQENKTMYFEPSAFEEESGYTVIKGAFK